MIFFRKIVFIVCFFLFHSGYSEPLEIRFFGQKAIHIDSSRFAEFSVPEVCERPEPLELVTQDGNLLAANFYDRGSDKVIILMHGFNASKDKWLKRKIIHIFPEYDIVTFDYRWSNMADYVLSLKTLISPASRLVFDGERDVRAAVSFARGRKDYKQVIGLGECHGAYLSVSCQVKAQRENIPFFDKLILDSCWLKLSDFIDGLLVDPFLVFDTQKGYVPVFVKGILNWSPAINIARFAWSSVIPSLSLKGALKKLDLPVLFFYGKNDQLVSHRSFNTIWKKTKSKQKAAIITPYEHVANYSDISLYHYSSHGFIENDFDQFVGLLIV